MTPRRLLRVTIRTGSDRCPSLLRPFIADDGAIIRLRVPGGRIRVAALSLLLSVAERFGEPALQLTSRGNIQLRALPNPLPDVAMDYIESTGLLPSASHERVRNILASPLARQLDQIVKELDQALCADEALSELPGRFLFAIADDTGSALSEPFDVAYQALTDDDGLLLCGGVGTRVTRADAVEAIIDRARQFLVHRPSRTTWNMSDLPGESPVFLGLEPVSISAAAPLMPGAAGNDRVVGVPLGLLTSTHIQAIAQLTDTVVLTPWRSFVIRDAAASSLALADAGLITTADSPWTKITACVGAPSCRRGTSSTLQVARELAPLLPPGAPPVHLVGCDRQCGHPSQPHRAIVGAHSAGEVLIQLGVTT